MTGDEVQGMGRGTEREAQSSRGAIERETMKARIAQLEAEVTGLSRTIVGLGSLVAQAAVAGYIASQQPEANQNGGHKRTTPGL